MSEKLLEYKAGLLLWGMEDRIDRAGGKEGPPKATS